MNHYLFIPFLYQFQKTTCFKSEISKHQKTSYGLLCDQFSTGCQPKQCKKLDFYLRVPKTPPTDTETSKLIKIEYIVEVCGVFKKEFFGSRSFV